VTVFEKTAIALKLVKSSGEIVFPTFDASEKSLDVNEIDHWQEAAGHISKETGRSSG
jgi:hypothetical protein